MATDLKTVFAIADSLTSVAGTKSRSQPSGEEPASPASENGTRSDALSSSMDASELAIFQELEETQESFYQGIERRLNHLPGPNVDLTSDLLHP